MPSSFGKVLSLVPSLGNNNNIIGVFAEGLSSALRQRGLTAEVAYVTEPDFLPRLFTAAQDPETLIYYTNFFMDLRVTAHQHFQNARLNDLFPCKTMAFVADQPFINFMWERVGNCHPETLIQVVETAFVPQAQLLQPGLKHFRFCNTPLIQDKEITNLPHEDRDIDVLIPLGNTVSNPIDNLVQQYQSNREASAVLDAAYQLMRKPVERPAFDLFNEAFQQTLNMAFPEFFTRNKNAGFGMLQMLSQLDRVTRNERRRQLVNALLQDIGDLRIHMVGDFSDIPAAAQPGIQHHGALPADQLCDLMGRSKAVVNSHPNLTECLHERVVNAGAYGCMVISDHTPVLVKELGDDWVNGTDRSAASIFDEYDGTKIATMGAETRRRIFDRHLMTHFADDFIAGAEARWG
ncbi:MAG: glycosyltransferase [Alphaproteobacteria bacterium]|nr:glycosyltransferase [Alphaproteobacteria bacterium SS10]